ncbi:hypothetical protein NIES2119_30895 [[Phormidium ambiguum] IAM M-71]|uniref:Uncharacterized protein n=1 Tax=[Phormidium ambiguum] IAM M-71 TaxID=454136 RepID=A0A1U7I315_9CYAN|nr:hypothetical protein [Phormidium ambiguum]OKH30484.1 hypothetical protein NIES2119_30895 [Phormidium ambiguum IAM M-71]
MESNIYKLCLASSFSLFCLLTPKTVTAQEIFLSTSNLDSQYQEIIINSVIAITKNLNIDTTISATNTSESTNTPKQKGIITNTRNEEMNFSQSSDTTGLAAKGGKKPPRKG